MFSPGQSGGKRVVLPKPIEQEIAHGILNLTRRIHQLQVLHRSEERKEDDNNVDPREEAGAGIITLAGHNCGATMNVAARSKDGHETSSPTADHTTINIYINNNVQGVNNSILYNSSCTLRDPGVGLDFSNSETSSEGAEGSSLGADPAVPDLEIKPSNGRYAGRKRSLSEILLESGAENEVAPFERSTRPEERSSSVNARIQGCSGENGDLVSDATGVEIVKAQEAPYERSSSVNAHIQGGSGESGAQVSSKVESNRLEIVKAGEVRRRQPGRLRRFLRKFLCSSTDVIE